MRPTTRGNRIGFTLIELLVVIGIIALLVSILLPVLSKVQASAKQTVCLSNLRQFGIMAGEYAAMNRGIIFYGATSLASNGQSYYWDRGSLPGSTNVFDPLDSLWGQYGQNAKVLLCPSLADSGLIANLNSSFNPTTGLYVPSYGWNQMMQLIHLNQVQSPTDTVLITDVYEYNGFVGTGSVVLFATNPSDSTSASSGTVTATKPDFHARHAGEGGVLWLDGHATMEPPVYGPSNGTYTADASNKVIPFPKATTLNIGFLARNSAELNSGLPVMDYYYLPKKFLAAGTDFSQYTPQNLAD